MPPSHSSRENYNHPVALIVGASRGIGRQIAIDLAAQGYTLVIAAKSISDPSKPIHLNPNPKSPQSTITTVANEIISTGGRATPIQVDVRYPESIQNLITQTIALHNRLDVLVYNSGAIYWAPVSSTPIKRFTLMQRVNPEGLYATVHTALPHMRKTLLSSSSSSNTALPSGRIIVVSPPIYSRFFRGKTPYAMGKIAMSVLTKGLAMDFTREFPPSSSSSTTTTTSPSLCITSLWPAVAIESAATEPIILANPSEERDLRRPTIFSDAVIAVLRAPTSLVNGELLLDEDFLRDHAGVVDFEKYNVVRGDGIVPRRIMPMKLPDLRVDEQDDEGRRYDSSKEREKAKL